MGRRVTLRIHYIRHPHLAALLALALLTAASLGYLAWEQSLAAAAEAQVSAPLSGGPHQFYLTRGNYDGDEALMACAEGYHFASLWEIMDLSALRYNTDLGKSRDDSGQGPPAQHGWVRTGYAGNSAGIAGRGNCNGWTSDLFADSGTYVFLPSDWTGGEEDLMGWAVASAACSGIQPVWCVEDIGGAIYLPLVVRIA
jgi:hypothetical protein